MSIDYHQYLWSDVINNRRHSFNPQDISDKALLRLTIIFFDCICKWVTCKRLEFIKHQTRASPLELDGACAEFSPSTIIIRRYLIPMFQVARDLKPAAMIGEWFKNFTIEYWLKGNQSTLRRKQPLFLSVWSLTSFSIGIQNQLQWKCRQIYMIHVATSGTSNSTQNNMKLPSMRSIYFWKTKRKIYCIGR